MCPQTRTSKPPAPALAGPAAVALCLLLAAAGGARAQSAVPPPGFIASTETVRALQLGNPTLGLALGPRTRLVYEPRPVRPWAEANAALTGAPAQARVGLEFKTVSPSTGARNLLRVQLAGGGALQFRPRGGGLTVAYREQF